MQKYRAEYADTLLRRLTELGVGTRAQLEDARREQAVGQERMAAVLVRLGLLRELELGRRLSFQLGMAAQRLDPSVVAPEAAGRIPQELCRIHRIAPIAEQEGRITVGTDDPLTLLGLDWLQRRLGLALDVALIREDDLNGLLQREPMPPAATEPGTPPQAGSATGVPERAARRPPQKPAAAVEAAALTSGSTASDEPIIRLVDSLLSQASTMRASDIHLEPQADMFRVRYRIDGILHDVNQSPKALHGPVVSRIKILGGLNIAERRLPQDGRLQLTVAGKMVDVRISVLPALHGEAVVMRLLSRSQQVPTLQELGMPPEVEREWRELIGRPYGMILVTGPTGSGKSTTLYATLSELNTPQRKLITIEDPVEYQLPGVNQVQVKPMIGLTFAAGLRAMLRQAPDIIMVGEIRDQETAQIAIQAALTGHLVFSTLHTNDAPSAVTRLVDMGVPPFLAASTVQGVLAQRLVRRVCPTCAEPRTATPEEAAFLGADAGATVTAGEGCEECATTGYFGRLGLYELFLMTDKLRNLVVANATASKLAAQGRTEGMHTLQDDGRAKVAAGLTTMEEALRAAHD